MAWRVGRGAEPCGTPTLEPNLQGLSPPHHPSIPLLPHAGVGGPLSLLLVSSPPISPSLSLPPKILAGVMQTGATCCQPPCCVPVPTQDGRPVGRWGCGWRRLGQGFPSRPAPRCLLHQLNSGISSPCGEKGGARAGKGGSKGKCSNTEGCGDLGGGSYGGDSGSPVRSGVGMVCGQADFGPWPHPGSIPGFGAGNERGRRGLGGKGKRKNLHVENTRPSGQNLKQQESSGRHKGSNMDKGVAGVWGREDNTLLPFGVLPQFPQGGRWKGRMPLCFFPVSFLPRNIPLGMPGWGRGEVGEEGAGAMAPVWGGIWALHWVGDTLDSLLSSPLFLFNISSLELWSGLRFYSSLERVTNILCRIRPHLGSREKNPNCHKGKFWRKAPFFWHSFPFEGKQFPLLWVSAHPDPHPSIRPPCGAATGVNLGLFRGKWGPSSSGAGQDCILLPHQCFPQARLLF